MNLIQLGRATIDGRATALIRVDGAIHRLADVLPDAPGVADGLLDPLVADWDRFASPLTAATPTTAAITEPAAATFLAPLVRPPHLLCIGANYSDHIAEMGVKVVPEFPYAFLKPLTTIAPPAGPVPLPPVAAMVDWEVELGVVIGRTARHVAAADAMAHVAAYLPLQDISARDWIASRPGLGIDWVMQKGHDAFTPLAPWLTLASSVPDPQALPIECHVNGVVAQRSTTANMLFSIAEVIAHLSSMMTLSPGDIIATGTPAGVGFGRKPPEFLKAGDVVTTAIGPLGSFDTHIVAAAPAARAA